MAVFLYKLSLLVYQMAIRVAALYNDKAKLWIHGRKDWRELLASKLDKDSSYIWVHCASLGEFEQGRPLIEGIKSLRPQSKILLSFFSPSGYEMRKDWPLADIVCYLPMDSKVQSEDFIHLVKPEMALFVKYELWYYYLSELQRLNIPAYLVSAYFTDEQRYFRPIIGPFFRNMLGMLNHIFIQDESSLNLLQAAGITHASVSGDTRMDRVLNQSEKAEAYPELEYLKEGFTLIAGSTWPADIELLEKVWKSGVLDKIVIAPHEIDKAIHFPDGRNYSAFENSGSLNNSDALIIDKMGMLSSLYSYGRIAYIGGGFGDGIHNILEAAVYGMPIFFGPNNKRFKEARDLIDLGGAVSVKNSDELISQIKALKSNASQYQKISAINSTYVKEMSGATERILKHILSE